MDTNFSWRKTLTLSGVILSALSSGTLLSLSLVSIPTALHQPTRASMLATWKSALDTGFKVCPPLAVLAGAVHLVNLATLVTLPLSPTLGAVGAAGARRGGRMEVWALAAAAGSTLGIVPFTIFVLQGVNKELFAREKAAREEVERGAGAGTGAGVKKEDVELVKRWWRLNLVRAGLPALGAVCAAFVA